MSIIAQNTPPPAETSEIGSRISLSPRTAKVITSMAASAWLLGVQMEMDLSETVASSLAVGTIAAFSETFLRAEEAFQGDWYETRQINWDLLQESCCHVAIRVVGFTSLFGPIQHIGQEVLNASFKTIGKILLAPIAEEIFFRGFLEDLLEDIIELANQHFHRLSSENKTLLRQALSATLFGALHITGNQVEGIAMKALVFISVTFMGYELSLAKERHRSLLASMMVHASQNLSCIIGMAKYGLQIAAGNAIYNFFGR